MTEGVVFLRASNTLLEAWSALHAHAISGAPVLNEVGRLVGIVSKADLADPRHQPPTASGTVEGAMTRVVYAVRAEDPVMTAVRLMSDQAIHRAMVVNDDGTIAGIVAPMDILRALLRGEMLNEPAMPEGPVEFVDLHALARTR